MPHLALFGPTWSRLAPLDPSWPRLACLATFQLQFQGILTLSGICFYLGLDAYIKG